MNLNFYQITNINDNIQKYPLYRINKLTPYRGGGYILDNNYRPVYFGYYR
jgi:hypothetical protein